MDILTLFYFDVTNMETLVVGGVYFLFRSVIFSICLLLFYFYFPMCIVPLFDIKGSFYQGRAVQLYTLAKEVLLLAVSDTDLLNVTSNKRCIVSRVENQIFWGRLLIKKVTTARDTFLSRN